MRTYDILADFGVKDEHADRVSLNAGCVVAFYRYAKPATYSRRNRDSISQSPLDAVEMLEPIFVTDILSAVVASSKANHISTAQLQLAPTIDYLSEVMPGDFVFVWMLQKEETLTSLLERLKSGKQCNKFNDGLKFFGRVVRPRKRFSTFPNGVKTLTHTITGVGFSELDAAIYFEPYLALRSVGMLSDWLQKTGIRLNEIIASNGQGVAVNKIIPEILRVMYGTGIPANSGLPSQPEITNGLDNPYAFIIPSQVGKVFGVDHGSKPHGLVAYTDVLEVLHGVQKYTDDIQITAENIDTSRRGVVFQPDISGSSLRVSYTGTPQLGVFLPSVPAMQGSKSVWSLISQFVNPTVNEIYTALRTNKDGEIFPTFVLRQLPFSTGLTSDKFTLRPIKTANGEISAQKGLDLTLPVPELYSPDDRTVTRTRFVELPRWRIHPIFIRDFDVGRDDALRFNFIHVQGESGARTGTNQTGTFVRDPPYQDQLDILRSGLRPYMRTVPCAPEDVVNRGAGVWMELLSDFLMGQHLMLTGSLVVDGIQQPIVPGDNVEVDETLLHIEAVTHSFSSTGGNRRFTTTLVLTHGVTSQQLDTQSNEQSLYTGIRQTQSPQLEPGITQDSKWTQ